MIYQFLKSYFYFLQRKKESIDAKVKNAQLMSFGTSRQTGKKELQKLKYYTYWVIFLSFLKVLNAFSITIVYGLYYSYRPSEQSDTLIFIFLFSTRFLLWFSDFVTMLTLVYIFYIQSKLTYEPVKAEIQDAKVEAVIQEFKKKGLQNRDDFNTIDI